MSEVHEFLTWAERALSAFFLIFMRIGAMMALFPAFGEQSVPVRVKLVLAIAFTVICAPALGVTPAAPEGIGALVFYGGKEAIYGLFFGAVLRILVMALQIAGTIAAQSTSLAQLFGGAGADPQPAIGHLLLVGGLALAAMMGLHIRLTEYVLASYELAPIGAKIDAAMLAERGVEAVSKSFALAFSLAAPFAIASLIYNVTLGVINRAMPQLMVAFVGAPAITAGGLLLLFVTAPIALSVWHDAFTSFASAPFGSR